MIVKCTHCKQRFQLDPSKIGPEGRKLRCTHCKKLFFIPPAKAQEKPASKTPPPTATLLRVVFGCPHCAKFFRVTANRWDGKQKTINCPSCHSPFLIPAIPIAGLTDDLSKTAVIPSVPDPAASPTASISVGDHPEAAQVEENDLEKNSRQDLREAFHTRSKLELINGVLLHGITDNVSAGGAFFLTDNPPEFEEVSIGDPGTFFVILFEGEEECFSEFNCQVARITEEGLGLEFIQNESSDANANHSETTSQEFKRQSIVYVRRSGGSFESGWEVLPNSAKLPKTITRLYKERKKGGLCVVCRKIGSQPVGYKIYTLQDLIQIQEDAKEANKLPSQSISSLIASLSGPSE